ncbi:hypothetical protein OGAPHI_004877 [Ogataea philodendri]|uniref:ATP-dependent (S)-NAD(P)H-hydrate dehydratase n=1 Tax=Ogataea philodendri TaxID=1378263 RepID=A0A9P8P1N8_9ASCO|nr:uncharacterized protein OGAPHI_004877 [Ogataea philodendri]KAH3664163.1 hypothetical protein OGAPHI_004877 [Ogataea philodendri]
MFKTLKSKNELVHLTRKIVPPLLPTFHKGQCGRIVVIGGCEDYTGAPFFSAHAASLLGCDLAHVICEYSAATVIKSYSPDLMVHPYMQDSSKLDEYFRIQSKSPSPELITDYIKSKVLPKIQSLLDRIHVVVLGPGFGRDKVMLETMKLVIQEIKKRDLPVILDADSLYLVSQDPDIIKGYSKAVITPNPVEFKRIADALHIQEEDPRQEAKEVSKALKVTILRKGPVDVIVDGDQLIIAEEEGGLRRVGGLGDSLSGMIATFMAWGTSAYRNQIWDEAKEEPILSEQEVKMLACFGGSIITKQASKLAFEEHYRSMQTSDVHKYIGQSFLKTFGKK